jgi:hypothetical protein
MKRGVGDVSLECGLKYTFTVPGQWDLLVGEHGAKVPNIRRSTAHREKEIPGEHGGYETGRTLTGSSASFQRSVDCPKSCYEKYREAGCRGISQRVTSRC